MSRLGQAASVTEEDKRYSIREIARFTWKKWNTQHHLCFRQQTFFSNTAEQCSSYIYGYTIRTHIFFIAARSDLQYPEISAYNQVCNILD